MDILERFRWRRLWRDLYICGVHFELLSHTVGKIGRKMDHRRLHIVQGLFLRGCRNSRAPSVTWSVDLPRANVVRLGQSKCAVEIGRIRIAVAQRSPSSGNRFLKVAIIEVWS
jgi:hypothetical protein